MIRVIGASPTFSYCRIEQSRFAAGITMESGSRATLLRNVIVDNGFDGIGVSASAPTIENNTILRNGRDGIANATNAATSIKNNIIVNNSRYGIFCDAGSQLGTAISYNDVWNNSQANYQGCSAGVGDLSDDPQFIDAANGIFALLSRSPCVDAGDPKDFDPGTVSRVDLGAFPFSGVPGVPIRIVAVSGNAQNWYVDNSLLAPLVVEVTDAFVNGIAGVKVDFTITTGSGFLDTQTINTDANGRAQTQWRLGSEVGEQRVDVRAADFNGNLLAGAPVVFTAVADSLPPPPSVAFTADVTDGFTPLKVQFTSQTAGVFTALLWRFGDGDSSAIENPQHTYQDSGAYTVSLKAVGPGGEQRLVQENYIMAKLRIFGSIAGRVIDYNGKEPVAGVRMRVTGTTMDDTTTNSQGNYSFASIRVGTNYVLKPERTCMFFQPPKIDFPIFNDDFKGQNFIASLYGDVSGNDEIQAFDASVLLRYLIGLLPLKDLPHDSIAADVSGNAGLSAFDASLILRFVAGLLERFPVEDSATAKIQAPAVPTANVRLAPREPTRATHFTTPILFESSEEIYAGDLSVSFDPQRLRFSDVATSEKFEKFFTVHAQHENEIRIVLAGTQPVSGSGVLLLLDWEILGETELGSAGASVLITRAVFNESPVQIINAPFENLPSAFYLWPNYPNPFNPQTQINYDLPTAVFVSLEIFNVLGQKVRTLVHEQKAAGSYNAVWDGRRDDGNLATSGIYIYRLRTKTYENSRTLLFLR